MKGKIEMGCLVVFLGALMSLWGLATIVTLNEGVAEAKILTCIIEVVFIALFVVFYKKYQSPENQEQRKIARENALKQREANRLRWEAMQKRQKEAERLRTTVVSTRLLGAGTAEYKKGVGDMAARAAIGSVFGVAGAVIGAATAKEKNVNKNVRRFLVKYLDGHVEEKEATIGSSQYKTYMEHLEWAGEEK